MSGEATQLGRMVIPTAKLPKPGGPRDLPDHKAEAHEPEWHGAGILYTRMVKDTIELRLFYEGHISEDIKDEIARRFGVGAIQWEMASD